MIILELLHLKMEVTVSEPCDVISVVYYMYNRLFVLVLVAIKPPWLRKVRSVITLSVNTSSK